MIIDRYEIDGKTVTVIPKGAGYFISENGEVKFVEVDVGLKNRLIKNWSTYREWPESVASEIRKAFPKLKVETSSLGESIQRKFVTIKKSYNNRRDQDISIHVVSPDGSFSMLQKQVSVSDILSWIDICITNDLTILYRQQEETQARINWLKEIGERAVKCEREAENIDTTS
jgi:hypothetical protein